MPSSDSQGHAASVALCFGGSVLMVLRDDGTWAFPGGRSEGEESPLETAKREFREEVEANSYLAHPWSPSSPFTRYEGSTPSGSPHTLFVFKVQSPPSILGVQEGELQDWAWAAPSEAVLWEDLHHGVQSDLRQLIADPRVYSR